MIRRYLFIATAISLLLASCVTAPPPSPPRPAWVDGVLPEPYPEYVVAWGRAEAAAEAELHARADLRVQLGQILAREAGELAVGDRALFEERVQLIAEARVRSTEPEARWVEAIAGAVEVSLLVRYRSADRVRDALELSRPPTDDQTPRETPEPTPEEEPTGEAESATPPLLEVVRAALAQPPASAAERTATLELVIDQLDGVVLDVSPQRQEVALGGQSPQPVTVRLRGAGEGASGATAIVVALTAPDGEMPVREELRIFTLDERGEAVVELGRPVLSGVTTMRVAPAWLDDIIARWDPDPLRDQIEERLSTVASVIVTSRAREIPTVIAMSDLDIAGNPIGSGETMRGAALQMADAGFRVREVELTPEAQRRLGREASLDIAGIYDLLPFDVLSQSDRAIVGSGRIVEFVEGDTLLARVEVVARAWDLRRDELLAEVTVTERITGTDARAVLRTAFQAAGRRLARAMGPRLP